MISVNEAKQIIRSVVEPLNPVGKAINDVAGLVLAEDIYAVLDIPAFNQSAMDGYALCFDDLASGEPLTIEGEVPAGVLPPNGNLDKKAVRIFTGAPVPPQADTVVMQEKVIAAEGKLTVHDDQLFKGANVRPAGAEIKKGDAALMHGAYLSAPAIGFLAGIGHDLVRVTPKPSVTIIITGNEFQQPGFKLGPGQVYESNSLALTAALQQLFVTNVQTDYATDDLLVLKRVLAGALRRSDMVILSGGVSVGNYDFVVEAASLCGVKTQFHRVKQRPGKPLFFGLYGQKPVFGLPGNPSSVLTCFYEYVTEAIQLLTLQPATLPGVQMQLAEPYNKNAGLTHFLKGRYHGSQVWPLEAQESFRLRSFAAANCLIKIEEEVTVLAEGDTVEVHKLF